MTVRIANRTVERADRLAAEVPNATSSGLEELESLLADADIAVNATSVGMESDETPIPKEALHAELAVLDSVYVPIDTRLLREAREVGAETIDGAWMLLFQGVEAFEIWTGRDAPIDAMNQAMRDAM
jgi:shikimate dehydrogenase